MESDGPRSNSTEHHTELLLYDYFKHLTTLSLVALGGVLTISNDAERIGERVMLIVVLLISTGGGAALMALDTITKARIKDLPMPPSIKWYRWLSASAFAMGIGAYLAIFLEIFR